MKRRGVTLVELMIIGVIICILSLILLTSCAKIGGGVVGGLGKDYSNGVRAGHLIKVSKKGLVYKSYEAELQVVDNIAVSNVDENALNTPKVFWQVSTRDEAIGKKLEDLVGKEIKIKYTQYLVRPIELGSDYEILSYEEIK